MPDFMLKLDRNQDARDGDVEIVVTKGLHRGERYSVRPKDHNTCRKTGRFVKGDKPSLCECIWRPVGRAIGDDTYEALWGTAEQRKKIREERVASELAAAKQSLADALAKRDAAVEQCHSGAAEARGRIDALAVEEQALRDVLGTQKDELAATDAALVEARKALEAAQLANQHALLQVNQSTARLESIERQRASAQDTAAKLDREAERVAERPEFVSRIRGARAAVARLEAEQRGEGAKLTPVAATGSSEAESEAA